MRIRYISRISLVLIYISHFACKANAVLYAKCLCTLWCFFFFVSVSALISIWNRRKIFFECRLFFFSFGINLHCTYFRTKRIFILNGFEWSSVFFLHLDDMINKNCVYFLALAVFNCNAKPFIWAQVCTWIYWDFKHRLENWIYFLLYKNVFLPSSLNQNCLHRSYESLYEPKMSPINKLTITPHIIIQIWCAYLIYSL